MSQRRLVSILDLAVLGLVATCACSRQPEVPAASAPPAPAAPETAQPETTAPTSAAPMIPAREGAEPDGVASGGENRPIAVPLVTTHGQSGGELTWTAPAGWKVETPSSAMRRAQYRIPAAKGDADAGQCAVYYFGPGQGGDIPSNVQRWAGQFKGAAGASVAPKVTETSSGGRSVTRVEAKGTYEGSAGMGSPHGGGGQKPGYMLLGAIVAGPDANWFFKCAGPEKTMEANRKGFDRMIDSVH